MRSHGFRVILLIVFFYTLPYGQARFSWKPKPYPRCRSFLVTDLGYFLRLTPLPRTVTDAEEKARNYVVSNIGYMQNINRRYAIGFSNFLATYLGQEYGVNWGVKLGFRKWLNERSSVDLSPGIILWHYSDDRNWKTPGFTGSIDLKWRQALGISLIAEYVPSRAPMLENDLGIYLGVELGSLPGLIATGVGAAGMLTLLWVASALAGD